MNQIYKRQICFLQILGSMFWPSFAAACRCAQSDVYTNYKTAEHVLIARAKKTTSDKTEFEVIKRFKGEVGKIFIVKHSPLNCDFGYTDGSEYLIFEHDSFTTMCDGTKELLNAKDDESFLSKYRPGMTDIEVANLLSLTQSKR